MKDRLHYYFYIFIFKTGNISTAISATYRIFPVCVFVSNESILKILQQCTVFGVCSNTTTTTTIRIHRIQRRKRSPATKTNHQLLPQARQQRQLRPPAPSSFRILQTHRQQSAPTPLWQQTATKEQQRHAPDLRNLTKKLHRQATNSKLGLWSPCSCRRRVLARDAVLPATSETAEDDADDRRGPATTHYRHCHSTYREYCKYTDWVLSVEAG